MTQVNEHVKIRLTSQLINYISRVLQKLFKYFNCTVISTSFVIPSTGVFPVIFTLDFRIRIQKLLNYHLAHPCNISTRSQVLLNNYYFIPSNYTLLLQYQYP